MKNNSNQRTMRVTIVVILLIVGVIGYYCYLVNRPVEGETEKILTMVDDVLLRDLTNDYPPTVKEVVKYHNEINKCLYNESMEQETFEKLAKRDRELYDVALLANNEWDAHIAGLVTEVLAFQEGEHKLTGAKVGASTDVYYFEKNGHSFAKIPCSYTVMQGTNSITTMHIFLLRKDTMGHWKIYGWDLADNVETGDVTTENVVSE